MRMSEIEIATDFAIFTSTYEMKRADGGRGGGDIAHTDGRGVATKDNPGWIASLSQASQCTTEVCAEAGGVLAGSEAGGVLAGSDPRTVQYGRGEPGLTDRCQA